MLNDTANTHLASTSDEGTRSAPRLSRVLDQLQLDAEQLAVDHDQAFAFRAPDALIAQIKPGDPSDPILRQILPTQAEREEHAGYSDDPVGEAALNHDGALLQKYAGRALLITTEACDVHCRYCFRRAFDYAGARSNRRFDLEFEQLRADPSITELILSGGDPLTLSDERLADIIDQAASVPHLQRLRIHSRSAIVRPDSLSSTLIESFEHTRLDVVLVVHANCANELSPDCQERLQALKKSGVVLLNQAVLLNGVNDSLDALEALSHRLFACGVLPYYLHLLDSVRGAAHFSVPQDTAIRLVQELRNRLPGYLMPTLVREDAGAASKTPLN